MGVLPGEAARLPIAEVNSRTIRFPGWDHAPEDNDIPHENKQRDHVL